MRAAIVLACVLAAAGCRFDPGGLGVAGADARGGDVDAAGGGPDAQAADAACAATCSGDVLTGCDGAPNQTCDLGCVSAGGAHCGALAPSNGATAGDLEGVTGALDVPAGTNLFPDTDSGTIWTSTGTGTTFTKVRDAGAGVVDGIGYRVTAGGVAIFAVDSLTVDADSYVRPYGSHPVILLSRGAVAISGWVDLSGGCNSASTGFDRSCPGAGGGAGGAAETAGAGCAGGGGGVVGGPSSGGGGGGYATDGGHGGDGDAGHAGGGGGVAAACTGASLVPLTGGGGGGGGGGGIGGGGGGGLQITSFASIAIVTGTGAGRSATIDAGGRGGDASAFVGGGGGGAGGGILLEAPAIAITGANVTANGGGGGAGRNGTQTGIGTKGTTTALPAPGGQGDVSGGGGGDGGAGAVAPTDGDGPIDGGGGGGGAIGRIRYNVPAAALTVTGAVVSPDASRGDLPLE